jgi:hypothetical protein
VVFPNLVHRDGPFAVRIAADAEGQPELRSRIVRGESNRDAGEKPVIARRNQWRSTHASRNRIACPGVTSSSFGRIRANRASASAAVGHTRGAHLPA